MVSVSTAIIIGIFMEYWPWKSHTARGRVLASGDWVSVYAKENSFHIVTPLYIASVERPGFDNGSITEKNILNLLHPSIAAASSISFGISFIKLVRINTEIGIPNAI